MTRALAKELGPEIAENAVCPGIIETEVGNSLTRSRGAELWPRRSRWGASACRWVWRGSPPSSRPSFITGQQVVIDGFQLEI